MLLLALVPLGYSTLGSDEPDFEQRVQRTLEKHPESVPEIARVVDSESFTKDDILNAFPDHRLEDAHLSRDTYVHWLYALVSAGAFVGLTLSIFPERRDRVGRLLGIGLFTGTAGILLLLGVQLAARLTYGRIIYGRSVVVIFFYLIKFIGFSYRAATDPDTNGFVSFLGFTLGVGLCEELCKALPVLWRLRSARTEDLPSFTWRDACRWGFISGVGFGVSEGITYSSDYYNGVFGPGIYVVRFVSCVALHAVWSASAGIMMVRKQRLIHDADTWWQMLFNAAVLLAVPMVLHGLYDTLLKKDMQGLALATAAASFGWFAWQVERMRAKEKAAEARRFRGAGMTPQGGFGVGDRPKRARRRASGKRWGRPPSARTGYPPPVHVPGRTRSQRSLKNP